MKHSLNKGTAKESILANFSEQQNLEDTLNNKQNKLVSGTNIKTINGNSLLGSGDIIIESSGASAYVEGDALVINNSGGTSSGTGSGSGGGGSAQVFVDVDELPTENIDKNSIYKLKKPVVFFVINGLKINIVYFLKAFKGIDYSYKIVDTLPSSLEDYNDKIIYIHNNIIVLLIDGTLTDGTTLAGAFGFRFKGYTDTLEDLEESGVYIYDNVESYNVYDGKYNIFPTKKYKKILEVSKTFNTNPSESMGIYTYSFRDALTEKDMTILLSYLSQKLNFKCSLKIDGSALIGFQYDITLSNPSYCMTAADEDSGYAHGYGLNLSGKMYYMVDFMDLNVFLASSASSMLSPTVSIASQEVLLSSDGGTMSLELYAEDDI